VTAERGSRPIYTGGDFSGMPEELKPALTAGAAFFFAFFSAARVGRLDQRGHSPQEDFRSFDLMHVSLHNFVSHNIVA